MARADVGNGGIKRALVLSGGAARGAFHAGVLQYIWQTGWRPDLICGTSIGALTAIALGCGMSPDEIVDMWLTKVGRELYTIRPAKVIRSLLGQSTDSYVDTRRLEGFLKRQFDFDKLHRSPCDIVISAVNLRTAEVDYFNHTVITLDHLMAACAVPPFFATRTIAGTPYWDGGIMDNTPLAPVLKSDAEDIVVVAISPIGSFPQPIPSRLKGIAEQIFELSLISAFQGHKAQAAGRKIRFVAPERMLGFGSLLRFSKSYVRRLIQQGYNCAQQQL